MEAVHELFTDAVTATLEPGEGDTLELRGLWDRGELEYEMPGEVVTRHRTMKLHFTFPAADAPSAGEGDALLRGGLKHPVWDVISDGVVTTLVLGTGRAAE